MTIIASVGAGGELGRGGDLCWHIPEDLRRFKALTVGHAVVMGRHTWESLPHRPLPRRLNIVLSSSAPSGSDAAGCVAASSPEGPLFVASLPEALRVAEAAEGFGSPFIIGGASVYAAALPLADRLEITRILASDPQADTFFPPVPEDEWRLESSGDILVSAGGVRYRYESYVRVSPVS